jgi:uncharacterized protein (TIGR03437 family)
MITFRRCCLLLGWSVAMIALAWGGVRWFAVQASFPPQITGQTDTGKTVAAKIATSNVAPVSLPMRFEKNQGQFPAAVQFAARGKNYKIGLTDREMILTFPASAAGATARPDQPRNLRLQFRQAQPVRVMEGLAPLAARTNYFRGKEATQWRTDIPNFEKVRARNLYPGIHLVYYGTAEHLEYDFEVDPGADPNRIELALHGAAHWRLTEEGDLVVKVGTEELRQKKPVAYQMIQGMRHEVAVRYQLTRHQTVRLQLGKYDATQSLVIDPVLLYSTLWGGRHLDGATLIRTDAAGNLYVLGDTQSDDFPVVNPAQARKSERPTPLCVMPGCTDIFISKFDPTGQQLLFSTYLGGAYIESALGMDVDVKGNVYVTGVTWSSDFPTTPGCFQPDRKGWSVTGRDVFVAKLNPTGSALLYSTHLGGSLNEEAFNLTVDAEGNAYVVGSTASNDFPTRNPLQAYQENNGGVDGFITKLNPWGTELVYSTYLGGNDDDFCNDIKVDQEGHAYVTGATVSDNFPTTFGAYQTEWAGSNDTFVCKLKPDGSAFVFSTLVGGEGGDIATSLALDAQKNIYVVGYSGSFGGSFTFPLVNPIQRESHFYPGLQTPTDVIVFKLNATGADLLYSTYLGGHLKDDSQGAFAVDAQGRIYLAGGTASYTFPVTPDAIQPFYGGGTHDGFVAVIDPAQVGVRALVYSSYLGGSGKDLGQSVALDPQGNLYVCGFTQQQNIPYTFPLVNARQSEIKGVSDAFLTKIALTAKGTTDSIAPTITLTAPVTGAVYTTTNPQIVLAGNASDNVGVTQVTWRKHQQQTDLDSGPTWGEAKGTTQWKIENFRLQQGENQIWIAARDQAGNFTETSLTIQYQPEYLIQTIAGGGYVAARDDLPPLDARFRYPTPVLTTPTGDLFFGDSEGRQIWKLTATGRLVKVAGTGRPGSDGDGGPALQANLNLPFSLAMDKQGQLYFAEDGTNVIRMIDANGIIRTIAGNRAATGCTAQGDGGPAIAAHFCGLRGVAVNRHGELFLTDTFNHRIRKIDLQGIITTIAGTGVDATTGDGGPAKDAQLSAPHSLVFDQQDNLYIATSTRIRKISTAGTISTFAGGGDSYFADGIPATAVSFTTIGGLAFDLAGNLWLTGSGAEVVWRINAAGIIEMIVGRWETGFSGDGGAARLARLSSPRGIAIDAQGRIYFADSENTRIRMVVPASLTDTMSPSLTITSPTQTGIYTTPIPMLTIRGTASDDTNVMRVLWRNDRGGQGTAQGTSHWAIANAKLARGENRMTITAVDTARNQATTSLLVIYDPDQTPPMVAITAPTAAASYTATDVSLTLRGTATDERQLKKVWWRDSNGRTGIVEGMTQWQIPNYVVQTDVNTVTVYAEDAAGNIASDAIAIHYEPEYLVYTVAGPGIFSHAGNGGPATRAHLTTPLAVGVDAQQSLYVIEEINYQIRKITPDGLISLFAGVGSGVAGKGEDGVSALDAALAQPQSLLPAPDGKVYVADTSAHRIRLITPDGLIKTIAGVGQFGYSNDGGAALNAHLFNPKGMVLDATGSLLFADSSNHRIRKITPDGIITTVAGSDSPGYSGDGGDAKSARLGGPSALAFDAAQNLYIADTGNHCIRKVTPNGIITTVAGQGGKEGFAGDGGLAVNASLNQPLSIAMDGQGNLFIADTLNQRIRRVDQGIITTIAGIGPVGFTVGKWNGDGKAATLTTLNLPSGIASDRVGNLYIADKYNFRLRKLVRNPRSSPVVTSVPGTHYQGTTLAPESLVSAFGQNLAAGTEAAQSLPLPARLQGTRVWVRDSEGYEHPAPLLFVSPTQINYQLPKGTKTGTAHVIIENDQGRRLAGMITVQSLSPGIFTASADGTGVAAASVLRRKADGTFQSESTYRYDAIQKQFVALPIDLGPPAEQVFLEFYGSGVRYRSDLNEVQAKIGGTPVEVLYAGPQGGFVGLDQINLRLPRSLAGRGEVAVELTIRGTPTNVVKLHIQ